MRVLGAALLAGACLMLPAHSRADALNDAEAAERRDDCPTALSLYRSLAANGVVQAYKRLGFFSEIGYCVPRDWPEAAKWYAKAGDAGDKEAIASLSGIGRNWRYMHYGQPLNQTIYALVENAAKRGSAVAQVSLGVMNYPIDSMSAVTKTPDAGVTGDLQEAMSWYRRAAEQGDFDALVTLGVAYSDGIGVPQDYVEAYKFFNVAAPRVKYDDIRLETIKRRDEVAAKMTKAQLAEAQKLSREWKPTK